MTHALRQVKGRKFILGPLLTSAQASPPLGRALILTFRHRSALANVEYEFEDPRVLEVIEKAIAEAYGTPLHAVLQGPNPAMDIAMRADKLHGKLTRLNYAWSYTLPWAGLAAVGLGVLAGFLHILDHAGVLGLLVFSSVAAIAFFFTYALVVGVIWLLTVGIRKAELEREARVDHLLSQARSEIDEPDYEPDPGNERFKSAHFTLVQARRLAPRNVRAVEMLALLRQEAIKNAPETNRYDLRSQLYKVEADDSRSEAIVAAPVSQRLVDWLFTNWESASYGWQWTSSAPVVVAVACALLLIIPLGRDRYGDTVVGQVLSNICASYLPGCSSDVRGYSAREAVQKLEDTLRVTFPHDNDRVLQAESPDSGQTLTCYELHVYYTDRTAVHGKRMRSQVLGDTVDGFEIVYTYDRTYHDGEDSWTDTLAKHAWRVFPATKETDWVFELAYDSYGTDFPSGTFFLDELGLPSLEGLTCQP